MPCTSPFALSFLLTLNCISIVSTLAGCRQAQPDTRAADEETIRSLDAEWSKTAGEHNLDGTVAFYADNAVLLPPDEPAATNQAAIRASWAAALGAFETVSWEVTKVEVARSGDLAYLTGKWRGTLKNAGGVAVPVTGKLVEVWGRQPDGKWKCVADTYNSDAPAAGAAQDAKQ